MYNSFYNLSERPFQISTDPRFLWLGAKHSEALAVLEYALVGEKGFLLLTGDVGTGKTTLVNALLKSLDGSVLVASVTDPNLDLMGFLNHIARSFNITQQFDRKEDFLAHFKDFLKKACLHDGKHVLLIIDEAHKLSKKLLEQIRLLSNIELPEKKLINIFFVGQNELNQTLMCQDCRALRQRIILNYNIKPLSEKETRQYIKHRLKVAGTEVQIFSRKAIHEIYRFSEGSPRLINIICDRALLTGYVRGQKKIPPAIIRECSQEVLLPGETKVGSIVDFPQPVKSDNPPPVPERLFVGQNDTALQEIGSKEPPSKMPEPAMGGMSAKEKIEVQYTERSALKPEVKCLMPWHLKTAAFFNAKIKRPLRRFVSAIISQMPKRRRMIYGIVAACLVVLTMTFFPLPYTNLFSRSDHQEAVPRGFSAQAPHVGEKTLSSHSVTFAGDQAGDNPMSKAINAPTILAAKTARRSLVDQAKKALQAKAFSRAMELLEYVMARQEGNEPEIKALYVQALQGQVGLLLPKDTDQREKLLRKVVKVDPQNAMAYAELGKLYTKRKDHVKAINAYSKAAKLNADLPDTFFNLGFSYAAVRNYENAEKMFLRVTEMDPNYLDKAIFNLALVQYKQGKKQQCVANLEKALKVNPGNQRARTYLERFTTFSGVKH